MNKLEYVPHPHTRIPRQHVKPAHMEAWKKKMMMIVKSQDFFVVLATVMKQMIPNDHQGRLLFLPVSILAKGTNNAPKN